MNHLLEEPAINVLIDLERLKYFHTGLGQFSHHLGIELQAAGPGDLSFTYLVPSKGVFFEGNFDRENASWRRKYFPQFCRRYDLWHSTHQDSSYGPATKTEKFVLTIHDLNFLGEKDYKKSERRLRRLQRKVDRADAVTVISDFTRSQVEEHLKLGTKPVYRIYNGVPRLETSSMREPPGLELNGKPYLLYLGVVRPKKNVHVLPAFLGRLRDFQLVLAGGCDSEYLECTRAEAAKHGVTDRIRILGEVDAGEKTWLYSHCEAFVFPSLHEGFGIPVVEAMSLGKPVFISDRSSLPEVAGPDAFVWRNFDPREMEEVFQKGMAAYLADPEMKKRLQKQTSRYSWRNAACEYIQVYRDVLGL